MEDGEVLRCLEGEERQARDDGGSNNKGLQHNGAVHVRHRRPQRVRLAQCLCNDFKIEANEYLYACTHEQIHWRPCWTNKEGEQLDVEGVAETVHDQRNQHAK